MTLNSNQIVGNTVSGNGGDPGPAVSLPSLGVEIFTNLAGGAGPITGTVIRQNRVSSQAVGVYVGLAATALTMHQNNLTGTTIGVEDAGTGVVHARQNYWGCATGPGTAGCASVRGPVEVSPWLTVPPGN